MRKSLEEVHGSIDTTGNMTWKQRFLRFSGPAFLVAVGYMDPGNWATDLAGGSRYGYSLLWVLLMSNLIALLLQSLCARLGVVQGRDLAQSSRETYPKWANISLYVLAEIAICACDLAEVVGMAIGLNLLFGLPLIWGVSIAVLDTFLILYLQSKGMRYMEMFILSLVGVIGFAFLVELFFAKPDLAEVATGFIPSIPDSGALYIAIGIIGATVMPHNLYLHSSLVQTRRSKRDHDSIRTAIKFNFFDSAIALNLALFVNASILILAAAVFFTSGHHDVVEIQDAHGLLAPLLGEKLAPVLFAIALIASGQSSTITGTLAGQIIMEGYLDLRIAPWLRRLITRLLAITPAFLTIILAGEDKLGELLILSQVVLSLQLGFAVIPLIHAVSNRQRMKEFAIGKTLKILAWVSASIIVFLNLKLVNDTLFEWKSALAGHEWVFNFIVIPLAIYLLALLVYATFHPIFGKHAAKPTPLPHGLASPLPIFQKQEFHRIAICIDFSKSDVKAIAAGISQGKNGESEYFLLHVVETAGARVAGADIEDFETDSDAANLRSYAESLRQQGYTVQDKLGFGSPRSVIPKLVKECQADLLVMGSHGHRGFKDLIYGETVSHVQHNVDVPVLVV